MSKKLGAWMLLLGSLVLLSLGFTPYSRTANYTLILIRLALIGVLSVLFVRERWKYRNVSPGTASQIKPDAGDSVLRRWRRWYYGAPPSRSGR